MGYVEASRGCLHLCLHCPIPSVYGGRFLVVAKEIVRTDIRNLVRAGAEHITFGDPDFLNGRGHSLDIVRGLHQEFSDLTFDFTAKVEHILKHAGLMSELAQSGFVFAVSAVESLSDTMLANLEKRHTRADVSRALEIFCSAGIPLRPSLVSFTPWTTLDDYLDVLDFVETEGLHDQVDPVHCTIRLLDRLPGRSQAAPGKEGVATGSGSGRGSQQGQARDSGLSIASSCVPPFFRAGQAATLLIPSQLQPEGGKDSAISSGSHSKNAHVTNPNAICVHVRNECDAVRAFLVLHVANNRLNYCRMAAWNSALQADKTFCMTASACSLVSVSVALRKCILSSTRFLPSPSFFVSR